MVISYIVVDLTSLSLKPRLELEVGIGLVKKMKKKPDPTGKVTKTQSDQVKFFINIINNTTTTT